MRFYLSAASAEVEMAAEWIRKLESKGHECVHNWTSQVLTADRPESALNDTARNEIVDADLQGAASADVFWLLVGDVPSFGAGCEFMHAVDEDVPLIVVSGNCRKSVFTVKATVCFSTHEAAFAYLAGRE